MPATIKSAVLVKTLLQHLKGKTAVSVNFTFTPDIIKIQSSNEFIYDTFLTGEYTNDMVGNPVSVSITNALNLLNSSEGDTKITVISDKVVLFEQDRISIPFSTTYDERIDVSWDDIMEQGSVGTQDISSMVKGFRNLINISKSLDVGIPPVTIASGKVYCLYSNSILIDRAPMAFPDMEIPYNTFSNLSKNLAGASVKLLSDASKKMLLLQVGNDSLAIASYKIPNMELLLSVEERISGLSYLGSFDISIISSLELLFKCFPKETVILSGYEDSTVGIMFSVADGKSVKAGFKDTLALFNISISTTQFDAIYKVFKDTSKVEVSHGRDIICLKSTGGKTLLLSGMTF